MPEVGRPTVITEEVLRKLDEAFAMGCTDLEACLYADISKTALYDYQLEHPEFAERKELLKENPILLARRSVVEALAEDPDLSLRFLERKKKDEFAQRVENTGKDGKDLPMTPTVINIIKPDGIELSTQPEAVPSVASSDGQDNE
jgi:hypothetical protein